MQNNHMQTIERCKTTTCKEKPVKRCKATQSTDRSIIINRMQSTDRSNHQPHANQSSDAKQRKAQTARSSSTTCKAVK
eukprot:696153-Amorphochlora_amoeboformis.AAC.1